MVNGFDLVVLESPRPIAVETLGMLDEKRSLPPVVLVDGEDYDYIHKDAIDRFAISLCFKRELSFRLRDVYPFPFSSYVVDDERYQFSDSEKELDIFFIAGYTHPMRMTVMKVLENVVEKHGYRAVIGLDREFLVNEETVAYLASEFQAKGARLALEDYLKCIARAKIAVSVRGFGRDTIRFTEIPSYNTLLLSDDLTKYGLIYPEPFIHEETAVFFNPDCSDLEELLVYYLEDDQEREKVARRGHEHLKRWHTNRRRAEFFLQKVEEEIGV